MRWLDRLAETEYAGLVDPDRAREVEFGTFQLRPDFPDRRDGNQLCRCCCAPADTDRLLALVEELYAPTDLPFRKLTGHDPATWKHLPTTLEAKGWQIFSGAMKVHREPAARPRAPELEIRVADPMSSDLEALYTRPDGIDRGFLYTRGEFERVGGEYLVGYAEGEPACCTGWYAVGGIARFRHVYTAEWARDRGYAGTLIQHVQDHPTVRAQDALVIFVDDEGPAALYEALGFRTAGTLWTALRLLD